MSKRYYKVWGIEYEDDKKRAVVEMSRSRKAQDNSYDKKLEEVGGVRNGYVNEFNDKYVQFVGKAYNQLKKYEIKSGDTIIADIDIYKEPYASDGELVYPKNFTHKVFEFELPGSSEDGTTPAKNPKNFDREPRVGEDTPSVTSTEDDVDDEELPF